MEQPRKFDYFSLLFFFTAAAPLVVTQSWDCSTGTNFCILNPSERRSWHEASVHCFQRYGGLAHSDHFQLIRLDNRTLWIGLGWVNGRLQWMSHAPHEEKNLTIINHFAGKRNDPAKLCYFRNQEETILDSLCQRKLNYVCVKPQSTLKDEGDEDQRKNTTDPSIEKVFIPELIPSKSFHVHSPFLVAKKLETASFRLECKVPSDASIHCSKTRIRWLQNGAYKLDADNKRFISLDENAGGITRTAVWISMNWLGKVACEIFCFSSGQTYRSKEAIIVLEKTAILRVEFLFRSGRIDIMALSQHFKQEIEPKIVSKIGVNQKFNIDVPFLSRPEESVDTYSFYAYHIELEPNALLNLTMYLWEVKQHFPSDFWLKSDGKERDGIWLVGGSRRKDLGGVQQGLFLNINAFMLNYCLEGPNNSSLVFANQPTLARGINSHFRNETMDVSECHYASHQCRVDWVHSARMESWNRPPSLGCIRCMALFDEHKERCMQIIRPQVFAKSIAQCMSEYQLDQVDNSWNLADWVRLSLTWINEARSLGKYENVDLRQIWLPVQRRTHHGPLRPIWPWNFNGTNRIQESSWEEEMKSIMNHSRLSEDFSQIDPSFLCLTLDTQTRTLKSAACQERLPIICVRPKLKIYDSIFYVGNNKFVIRGQCPSKWKTSSLITERNQCFRLFRGQNLQFDDAVKACKIQGGQLAVISNPSILTVLLTIFSPADQEHDFWIGLKKKKNEFQWIDGSSWTYQNNVKWVDGPEDDVAYGVSLNFLNETHQDNTQNSMTMRWKRWSKEANLTGHLCQKKIFPQPQVALNINLNRNNQPIVSILPVQLHLRESTTDMSSADAPLESFILSNLTCFMGNSTIRVNYQSANATANYQVRSNPFPAYAYPSLTRDPASVHKLKGEWRATETSCETWDTWSTESLQASWIIKEVEGGSESISSFIIWLRHRNQTYVAEEHDETFRASGHLRAVYKSSIENHVIRQFTERHTEVMSNYDPVAFEPERNANRSLLIKYLMVWKPNVGYKRDGMAILHSLHNFSSSSSSVEFDFISVRSPDFCPSEITTLDGNFVDFFNRDNPPAGSTVTQLVWPKSDVGSSVTPTTRCVTQEGHFLRRQCLGDRSRGLYWESIANKYGKGVPLCVNTSTLFNQLLATTKMSNTSEVLQTIRQDIKNWKPNVAEVELLAESLSGTSNTTTKELVVEDLNNLQAIIQKVYSLNMDTLIKTQQSTSFSSNLARSTETLLAKVDTSRNSTLESSGTRQRFQTESSIMAAGSWERNFEDKRSIIGFTVTTKENKISESTVLLSSNATDHEAIGQSNVAVLLPFQHNITSQTELYKQENITFIAYPDTRLIDASAASGKFSSLVYEPDPSQQDGWSQSEELFTGNGGMVQVHLSPQTSQLVTPVTLYFRPKRITTEENRHLLRCVFWNEQMNSGSGGWSIDGCWHDGRTENGLEICRCNHLSTFTLLVSRSEKDLQSTIHGAILNVITLIGSILSVVGLSLILLTFFIFPSWRKRQGHKLLFHLSLALISLLTSFIVGVDNFENANACRATAIFLHYFLLAAFCWMTIEAYYQYRRFVIVFGTTVPHFVLKVSLLGWGIPLLSVAAVLIYDLDSYTGEEGYCWLKPTVFYISVLGPIALLLLINLCFFVLVIKSISASGRGLRTNQSETKQAREKLIACFANFVLLGLSWVFGFFAIGPTNSIFYSYLFCLTTTLQGFLLFLLYVVRDSSTRQNWTKLFGVDKSAKCSAHQLSQSKTKPTNESRSEPSEPSESSYLTSETPFSLTVVTFGSVSEDNTEVEKSKVVLRVPRLVEKNNTKAK